MPAGGKGFFSRTWAETFNESRDVATRNTPIDLPYGKHVLEIEGRGGRGQPNVIQPAYQVQTLYPARDYQQAAYQTSQPAYYVQTNYPARYFTGTSGEDTIVYVQDARNTYYQFRAPGTASPAAGSYTNPALPPTVYATVYATEVGGVYQTSVQAYVGSGTNNTNAAQKGFINMKYDADV